MPDVTNILSDEYFILREGIDDDVTLDFHIHPNCLFHQVSVGDVDATGSAEVFAYPRGVSSGDGVSYGTISLASPSIISITGHFERLRVEVSSFAGTDFSLSLTGSKAEGKAVSDVVARVDKNSKGLAIINMDNDDYQMTAEESLNTGLYLVNVGNGTKTLTVFDSPNNPGEYKILVAGGGTLTFNSGAGDPVPVFSRAAIQYVNGVGQFDLQRRVIANESVEEECAPNQLDIRQLMHSVYLPPKTLAAGCDLLTVYLNVTKKGAANSYRVGISLDATATNGFNYIYTSVMAPANRMQSTAVRLYRTSATTVMLQTVTNLAAPFGNAAATTFTEITVPNLDTEGAYMNFILVNTANTDDEETATLKKVTIEYSGAT